MYIIYIYIYIYIICMNQGIVDIASCMNLPVQYRVSDTNASNF